MCVAFVVPRLACSFVDKIDSKTLSSVLAMIGLSEKSKEWHTHCFGLIYVPTKKMTIR